jgi:uncharacterized membrane protein (DUF485 family)
LADNANQKQRGGEGMNMLTIIEVDQALADPRFRRLASARARFRWGLSLLVLSMFFGLITLMSFAPALLAKPVEFLGVPFGIVLAFSMFIGTVIITGFYVHLSNTKFDPLAESVKKEVLR